MNTQSVDSANRNHSVRIPSLFDIFRGKNVPADQKSMAYAFIYRNSERTLTDAEANATHGKLVEQFRQRLHAVVRE